MGNAYNYLNANPWSGVDPYGMGPFGDFIGALPGAVGDLAGAIPAAISDVYTYYVRGETLGGTNRGPQPRASTAPGNDVLNGTFGRRLPDPSQSAYSPETGSELVGAFHESLNAARNAGMIGVGIAAPGLGAAGAVIEGANAAVDASQGDVGATAFDAAAAGAIAIGALRPIRAGAEAEDAAEASARVSRTGKASLRGFRAEQGAFRRGLEKIAPPPSETAHAHHIFPQAMEKRFGEYEVDVWNPKYGTWWEGQSHLGVSYDWNQEWRVWLRSNPEASPEQVLEQGRKMAKDAGLEVHF
jgi:hypothetical protein